MLYEILILGGGALLMLGMGLRTRRERQKLVQTGATVTARVAGVAETREGSSYVLEFETDGGAHRLHYPRPRKGEPLRVGSEVVLHYDPYKPEKAFVEGDRSVLMAEPFYYALGGILVVLLVIALLQ
jgi:hypothetical protein